MKELQRRAMNTKEQFTEALHAHGFKPFNKFPVMLESESEEQWTYYGPRQGTADPWLVEQFHNDNSWLVTTRINSVMHQGCGDSLGEAMADLTPIQKGIAARFFAMLGIH